MKLLNYLFNTTDEEQNPEEGTEQTKPSDSSIQSDTTIKKPRP